MCNKFGCPRKHPFRCDQPCKGTQKFSEEETFVNSFRNPVPPESLEPKRILSSAQILFLSHHEGLAHLIAGQNHRFLEAVNEVERIFALHGPKIKWKDTIAGLVCNQKLAVRSPWDSARPGEMVAVVVDADVVDFVRRGNEVSYEFWIDVVEGDVSVAAVNWEWLYYINYIIIFYYIEVSY